MINILIGCDTISKLTSVLNSLETLDSHQYRVIHAARFADIKKLGNSINSQLYIFCYRNNQEALVALRELPDRAQIPVLCISDAGSNSLLRWGNKQIVFTCTCDEIKIAGFLTARINSILLLQTTLPNFDGGNVHRSANSLEVQQEKNSLELEQKINTLLNIKTHIERLFPQTDRNLKEELLCIVNLIKRSVGSRKMWEDLNVMFDNTDPAYLESLTQKHPALTPVDLKYCCYIRMNLSNDDIKNILGINQESVRTHKYRLKKKLKLHKRQELSNYLRSLSKIRN